MRFGFAVKILGDPDLKSHDARRWQSGPPGVTPKIHFSSPRTELREMKRRNPEIRMSS